MRRVAAGAIVSGGETESVGKESRCPYCLDDLVGKERVVRCMSCRTPHHAVCFDEHGGCVAFGCGGLGKADAGQSIMLRRPLLELGARWREVSLQPLRGQVVRYRPAKRVASEEPDSGDGPIGPWVRLSLEQESLYANQDVKARVVVAVTRDTVVRRLELRVFDEPLDPDGFNEDEPRLLTARILGRAPFTHGSYMKSVLGLASPYPRLRPGMHPYQIEIPRLFGNIVNRGETRLIQVGVVLERVGAQTVASPRVTVQLVAPPPREPEPVVLRSSAVGDPAHAMILHAGANLLAGSRSGAGAGARAVWFDAPAEPAAAPVARRVGRPSERVPVAAPPFPDNLEHARIDTVGADPFGGPSPFGAGTDPFGPAPSLSFGADPFSSVVKPPPPSVGGDAADDLIGPPVESTEEGTRRDVPPPVIAAPARRVGASSGYGDHPAPAVAAAVSADLVALASGSVPPPSAAPSEPPLVAPGAPPSFDGPLGADSVTAALDAALAAAAAAPRAATGPPATAPAPPPSGPVVVRPRDSRRAPRAQAKAPHTPAPVSGGDGWTIFAFRAMTTAGPRTGRVLRARFAPRGDLPPLRLSLEVPPRGPEDSTHVLDFTIDCPHAVESIDLACRYELHDARGNELVAGSFPLIEEVGLVGDAGLAPGRTGRDDRIAVSMAVDPFLLEEARTLKVPGSGTPTEVVVRLACEGMDPKGSKATSGTRIVRLNLAQAGGGGPTSGL